MGVSAICLARDSRRFQEATCCLGEGSADIRREPAAIKRAGTHVERHRPIPWPVGSTVVKPLKWVLAAVVALLVAAGAWLAIRSGPKNNARTESAAASRVADGPVPGGELVGSLRSDPSSYNAYVDPSAATDVVMLLTQARLVRVNRATDELEPWLAERWSEGEDGRTYTLTLRQARFSDGVPFTAADVLFSFAAAYDDRVHSPLKEALEVDGKPLDVSSPDPSTVVVRFPAPFAPGLRLLDNLPILPKHRLGAALEAGTFANEWTPAHPLDSIAGLGPFVLSEHVSGQRLVFTRNPHYFRRDTRGTQLPYLDKLTMVIVSDQNTEALRLQAGETDFMANGEIRAQDYSAFKGLEASGRLRLFQIGVSLDPDLLWFNLSPRASGSPARRLLARKEFRQALSWGIDRQAIANGVYLGTAVPIFGPVSPGNATWYSGDLPIHGHDPARARALLAGLGLHDADGDGVLDTPDGHPVRFSMLSQAGHIRGRTAAALQAQLQTLGIGVVLVLLDPGGIFKRFQEADYDSIYFGTQASSTDPALNLDLWLSSGSSHFWNPGQPKPQTPWEQRLDALVHEQVTARDPQTRKTLFAEAQRILNEEAPAIYFVAPRVTIATSTRVLNPTPALQLPQLLWSADTLAAAPGSQPGP
jgi:peptide/nickel transport system substrate-binding protein